MIVHLLSLIWNLKKCKDNNNKVDGVDGGQDLNNILVEKHQ